MDVNNLPNFDGHIFIVERYWRQMIRANPQVLFVFGDNLARTGFGGQAREARGELNAVGIPTKISPYEYLTDDNFYDAKQPIVIAFVTLAQHLRHGYDVVWPLHGVGTGLARLSETAPQVFNSLERCREALFKMANDVIRLDI